MSLLQSLMQRGALPSANEARRLKAGGQVPPARGFMGWNSGFEGMDREMLKEILRAMELRENDPQKNLQRLIPLLRAGQR